MEAATRARLFHAQYQHFDADLPFWTALALQSGGPILEMGCGTGRLVNALAQLGYEVLGLDQDAAMLSLAKSQLVPAAIGAVTWIETDIASLRWNGSIQLAIGALNTFAYLDDQAFSLSLSSVGSVLSDSGLIGLDLPPIDAQWQESDDDDSPLDAFTDPDTGNPIEVRAHVRQRKPGQMEVSWLYDELHPDGRVERHVWEQKYFQRTSDQLQELIQQSGMTIRARYGDYDFSPLQEDSDRLLLVLTK